ncbi:MAG: NTP transferase domain-containing protein [Clostridia bacterium]|nr:NTP transferase domain-containing protein [Clostridia bacterium]
MAGKTKMTPVEYDVLKYLLNHAYSDQRKLSRAMGISLGGVNKALAALQNAGLLSPKMVPTKKAHEESEKTQPRNAVILAAGHGMRMIPIGHEISKGLIEIQGTPIIERLITQLHEAGIQDISIVVGFMKEAYDYLIDKYGVKLIRNHEHDHRNSYYSLYLARKELENTYIVPCDIWCDETPFGRVEFYPWYMVSEQAADSSNVRVNRKQELVLCEPGGNRMLGLAYVCGDVSRKLRENLEAAEKDPRRKNDYWEIEATEGGRMIMPAKPVSSEVFHEINTYEELREWSSNCERLDSLAIDQAAKVLKVRREDITGIRPMKMGMTNRSFFFTCRGEDYIMRIPGEGTDRMINRKGEKQAYDAIKGLGISDEVLFIDAETGFKLTRFIPDAVMCDFNNDEDVVKMFKFLHRLHRMKLKTDTYFDIFREMEKYESLWEGKPSAFRDYEETRRKIMTLRPYLEAHKQPSILTHMDPAAENFLKIRNPDGTEGLRLLDWEYSSMFDPLFDLVEFCLYTGNDRAWVDRMISLYYETAGETCSEETKTLIYCYMSAVGLMWTAWCEAKRYMGVDFMDYAMNQYRYAKDFYRFALERMGGEVRA